MKRLLNIITATNFKSNRIDLAILFFRVAVSVELILVHGLKKVGIDANTEVVPNPLHLPEFLNQCFADAANLFFPLLVIVGLFTRLAVLPTLAVTLTGYFVVHLHDSLWVKDIPFMYSISFLLLLIIGSGKYSMDYFIHKKLNKDL